MCENPRSKTGIYLFRARIAFGQNQKQVSTEMCDSRLAKEKVKTRDNEKTCNR